MLLAGAPLVRRCTLLDDPTCPSRKSVQLDTWYHNEFSSGSAPGSDACTSNYLMI